MTTSKLLQLALLWGVALVASALLVLAGRHWPTPPQPRADLVLALVVLPSMGLLLLLLGRWPLTVSSPAVARAGEFHDRRESPNPEQNQE